MKMRISLPHLRSLRSCSKEASEASGSADVTLALLNASRIHGLKKKNFVVGQAESEFESAHGIHLGPGPSEQSTFLGVC